jgi:outer membrane protein TolC
MANRPEMRTMRLRREMARRYYDIQLANAYPTVALFANYSWNRGQDMPPNDKTWRDGYQAGVAVSVPLFDGRATEGKVAEAEAMLVQVERGMEALDLGVRTQVRQSLLALKAAEEKVAAEDANVAAAQKNHEVAKARYGVGLATNLEVMDAQTQLTRVRAQRLQAVYEYNLAWIQLQAASGMPDEELAR